MKYFIFIFLSIVLSFSTSAQKLSDDLEKGKINVSYLEYLVKVKIDSLRLKSKVVALLNDSSCYLAASNQARYMSENNVLTHVQKNKKYKTLSERLKFFDVSYSLAAENAMMTPYNADIKMPGGRIINASTYGNLAHIIFLSWFHSPDHKRNAINKEHVMTGLSISINEEKQIVYACQVFVKPTDSYVRKSSKSFFPEFKLLENQTTNPFNIKYLGRYYLIGKLPEEICYF